MEDTPQSSSATIGADDPPDDPPIAETGNGPVCRPSRSRVDRSAEATALACVGRHHPEEALKILMVAYGARITAFARRIVRNRELANDVRQQVFLEAFQGIDKFQGRGTLWNWLCGIAYHRCLDELRRLQRTNARDQLEVLDDLAGHPDVALDADRAAQRRALQQCLGKLPPAMRTQLLMRCLFGLSYAEIGETIGAPHSTVQVRLSRILPGLRQCLRGEGLTR